MGCDVKAHICVVFTAVSHSSSGYCLHADERIDNESAVYTLFLGQGSHSTSYAKSYSFQVEGVKADSHSLAYKVAYRNQAVRVVVLSYQLEVRKQSPKQ